MKVRQLWWDLPRFGRCVGLFFAWWGSGIRMVSWLMRKVDPAMDTFLMLNVPVFTALALVAGLGAGLVGVLLAAAVAASIALLVWMIVIDTIHLPMIAGLRAVESFRRRVLKKNVFVCPFCHIDIWRKRWKVPAFQCPHGLRFEFVRPSSWGLLVQKGACGCRIGTMPWMWRRYADKHNLKMYCPNCRSRFHAPVRAIGIEGFGDLPHVSLAVVAPPVNDGALRPDTQFIRGAWSSLTRPQPAGRNGFHIVYAAHSSLPEFERLAGVSLRPPGSLPAEPNRKFETWVWQAKGARGKTLLYLHQSDMSWYGTRDPLQRRLAIQGVSGLVLIVPEGDRAPVESVLDTVRLVLADHTGSVKRRLRLPLVVIVEGVGDGEARSAAGHNLSRMAETNFTPVRYLGGGSDQSATAVKWLVRQNKKVVVV